MSLCRYVASVNQALVFIVIHYITVIILGVHRAPPCLK